MSVWDTLDDETRKKLREQYPDSRPPRPPRKRDQRVRADTSSEKTRRNMTITIHAQERMDERFGITDADVARLRSGGVTSKVDEDRWRLIEGLNDEEVKRHQIVVGLTDEEVARFIQGEVNDALIANRCGTYCPIELANKNVERWRAKSGGWYCWTADKTRGYVCEENDTDGLVVKTVLIGEDSDTARRKLQGTRR